MQRYNIIKDKIPREILLLKSLPCLYGKCSFCNYILDNSTNINEIIDTNVEIVNMISGEFGVVEIINSGSVFEIPEAILSLIREKCNSKQIHTIYFEVYYGYRKRLKEIIDYFPKQEIRFRIGIETFDDEFRERVYNKPFPTTNLKEFSTNFYACCLLICVQGQVIEQIENDIKIALTYFKEVTINVFVDNGTPVKHDSNLFNLFMTNIYPKIKDLPNIEILIDNKDLGVFVQ